MAFTSKALPPLLLLLLAAAATTTTTAQTAPGPSPAGPINITAILEKAGQYTWFIGQLKQTQADVQINNQVNNSHDGMTVFAPTDNAFNNLPSGTLNNLTDQQKVQLVQYHVCPKFYSLTDLVTVSNPVRTQASGQDGKVFGLYFSGKNNQVNVSTGLVEQPVYNALRSNFPLAVYQLDKVLVPKEFSEAAKAPATAPPADGGSAAAGGGGGSKAPSDAAAGSPGNGVGSLRGDVGLVLGVVVMLCMVLIS